MTDAKITELQELTSVDNGDLIPVVDISDPTMSASGSTKKVTKLNFLKQLFDHIADTLNPHQVTLTQVGGTTDHTHLTNIGTNTHSQIDSDLARLADTSGTNTGNQTNVDTVDTFHANATPTANQIPVLASDANLPDNTVDTGSIEDGAVTNAKIAANAGIALSKLGKVIQVGAVNCGTINQGWTSVTVTLPQAMPSASYIVMANASEGSQGSLGLATYQTGEVNTISATQFIVRAYQNYNPGMALYVKFIAIEI